MTFVINTTLRSNNTFHSLTKLKRYTLILTLIAIFLNALAMPLIYLDFELRRDYIAEVMCVNKKRPELKCLGQCYLEKKVEEQQEKEAQQEEFSKGTAVWITQSVTPIILKSIRTPFLLVLKASFKEPSLLLKDCLFDIFHPPRF